MIKILFESTDQEILERGVDLLVKKARSLRLPLSGPHLMTTKASQYVVLFPGKRRKKDFEVRTLRRWLGVRATGNAVLQLASVRVPAGIDVKLAED